MSVWTLLIVGALHTFGSAISSDAYRFISHAAAIIVCVADLTGTGHTGRGIVAAIDVTQTAHARNTTGAQRCVPPAAAVIGHIAELTGIVHALSIGSPAITVDHTGHTLIGAVGIETQRRSAAATAVVLGITDPTDFSDTLRRRLRTIPIAPTAHTPS